MLLDMPVGNLRAALLWERRFSNFDLAREGQRLTHRTRLNYNSLSIAEANIIMQTSEASETHPRPSLGALAR